MPRYSVWVIRLSLVYLAVGFTLGGLLLFNKGIALSPVIWRVLPAHIDFLLFGWTVQLIMGMAFWILPRFSSGRRRGNETLAWLSFAWLNLGIWIIALDPWIVHSAAASWLILLGRLLEVAAAVAFAIHAWPRIKASGA